MWGVRCLTGFIFSPGLLQIHHGQEIKYGEQEDQNALVDNGNLVAYLSPKMWWSQSVAACLDSTGKFDILLPTPTEPVPICQIFCIAAAVRVCNVLPTGYGLVLSPKFF